ncbi:MAG: calcium/sodium antiporter [Chloroflexi bacterium]|nr:calcium/sodium antiporter [Chloroflexota bacterium]
MIVQDILFVLIGLAGLFIGGNWLVKGAARLASLIGVSPLVVGLTVVALGTSAPELLVSLSAALQGSNDLVVGNVLGSNIANIGLVLGIAGLIFPVSVRWTLLREEILFMIGFSVLALVLALDGSLSRMDGLVLLVGFAVFTGFVYWEARRERSDIEPEIEEFEELEGLVEATTPWLEVVRLLAGLALLIFGAQFMVEGAVSIARALNVSEAIIGISLVAIGTSLPEVATCVIASLRRENDIVTGNVVGSNISNLMVILGLTALVLPITVTPDLLQFEFLGMIGFALVLLPIALRQTLGRRPAIILLGAYVVFIALTFVR